VPVVAADRQDPRLDSSGTETASQQGRSTSHHGICTIVCTYHARPIVCTIVCTIICTIVCTHHHVARYATEGRTVRAQHTQAPHAGTTRSSRPSTSNSRSLHHANTRTPPRKTAQRQRAQHPTPQRPATRNPGRGDAKHTHHPDNALATGDVTVLDSISLWSAGAVYSGMQTRRQVTLQFGKGSVRRQLIVSKSQTRTCVVAHPQRHA
jgi:hypothetical protein